MGFSSWLKGLFVIAPRDDDEPRADDESRADDEPRDEPAPWRPAPPLPAPPRWPDALDKLTVRSDGSLAEATPMFDVSIQGVPCRQGGLVSFHRNGRLETATLARTHVFGGETLAAGTPVSFDPDGSVRGWTAVLAVDRELPVRAADGSELRCTLPAGSRLAVDWGKLREVVLAAPVTLDGFAFPAETELIFGDSGSLSHVTCPEVIELGGVGWAAERTVVFEFGRLLEGWPEADGSLDGVPYQAGEIVRFFANGRLARCYLAEDTEIAGVPCQAGTRIYLDDEGGLIEGTLARDTELAGVPVATGSAVRVSRGAPIAMTPRADCEVDGVPCDAGKRIELYESGRLCAATLSRAHTIGEVAVPAGGVVILREDATPMVIILTDDTGAWWLCFDERGAIRRRLPATINSGSRVVSLRTAAEIDGLTAAAKTAVELSPEGAVESLVLASDQPVGVGALVGKAETRVRFDKNGKLASMVLAADTRIGEVPCAGARTLGSVMNDVERGYHEYVRFHPDGSVEFATLAEDARIAGVPLARGHSIARRADGSIAVATLAEHWTHPLGHVGAAHSLIGLFEDGSPSRITLAEPFGSYAAGTVLDYESPGVIKRVDAAVVPLGPVTPL